MRLQLTLPVVFLVSCIGICFPLAAIGQSIGDRVVVNKAPAPVVSDNFVVHASDPILARKVSSEAERFRKELALQWLGRELEPWSQKCPIQVEVGMHAGGETSFAFVTDGSGRGTPIDWQMKIYGPPDRLVDAVLPHEVTHTIFATHFGRPLPRWADEGACTTVEHLSERRKNHKMLIEFLTSQPSRGIPFNRMFTMRNYPHDILPLYAQGYSLAKFLIAQKGQRHFLNFVGKGLQNEGRLPVLQAWDQATNEFYSYRDLSALQISWLTWVRKGSPDTNSENLAAAESPAPTSAKPTRTVPPTNEIAETFTSTQNESWYSREMKKRQGERVAANWRELDTTHTKKAPARTETFHPRPTELDSRLPEELRSGSNTIWR